MWGAIFEAVKAAGSWVAAQWSAGGVAAAIMKAVVMSAVSYGIQKLTAPSAKGSLDPGITQTIRNPTAARRIIYGKRRVGGILVYAGTTDDANMLHMMIVLAGHEVESISDIYLNDKPLSGFDRGGRQKEVEVKWTELVSEDDSLEVTVNSVEYTGTLAAIETALTTAGYIVSSNIVSQGGESGYLNGQMTITVATVPEPLVVTSTAGTVRITDGGESYLYRVNTHVGTTTQAADTDAVTEIEEWTADHKLLGVAYVYVRLRFDRKSFPNGIPNVTALVEGKNNIYDPRNGSTGYTTNAALCFADYLTSDQFGFGASYTDDISPADLITAANISDQSVTLADGSTEPRYACNGVIDTDQTPKSVLERLLTAMSGTCVFSGGKWIIHAGAYRAPTITLDESDLRAGFAVQTKPERADLCNAVKGTYTYRSDDDSVYQPSDFPAVTNATYQAEDGEQLFRDVELQFTSSPSMAQRLAKIELEKARQGMTLKYPATLAALPLVAGDVVMINNTRMGWTAKPFDILEWEFAIDDGGALGIDLSLQETAAGVYDWNDGEETTVDLAPNTNLPSPYDIQPVTGLTVDETAVVGSDGTQIVNVALSWAASVTLNVDYYEIQGKMAAEDDWHSWSTPGINYQFNGIAAGYGYFVRVRAVSGYGAKSEWNTVSFFADGIDETVVAPNTLTIIATTDTLTAVWGYAADDAFRRGTQLWASETNDRSAAVLIDTLPGQRASYDVTGTFYCWVRAISNNGNLSDWHPLSATAGIEGTALTAAGLTTEEQAALDGAEDIVAGISDDGIISTVEKVQWRGQWDSLVAEYQNIIDSAAVHSVSTVSFTAASGALYGYMINVVDWDDTTTSTDLVAEGSTKTEFNGYWSDYLETRQLVIKNIAAAAASTANWSEINDNNGELAALETDVANANTVVADLAADGKLTASEKQAHLPNWNAVLTQKADLISQASALSVSSSAYNTAYTNLYNYMNPLMANVETTSDITRSTFTARWSIYFDEWQKLTNAIAAKAAVVADWANVSGTNKPADNATANQSDTTTNNAITAAAGTANWTNVSSRPTSLSSLNSTDGAKLAGIATGATVGATSTQATKLNGIETGATKNDGELADLDEVENAHVNENASLSGKQISSYASGTGTVPSGSPGVFTWQHNLGRYFIVNCWGTNSYEKFTATADANKITVTWDGYASGDGNHPAKTFNYVVM